MATGGLYGQSPTGALIAQPGTETTGLYGKSPNGSVIAQPGSESSGLYGQSPNFGGSYFEWFIFQVAAEQPATPTGGSWSFSTNTGTPPSGWSLVPPTAPTNPVWISIGLVNSKSNTDIVWSAPGVFSYSGQINGTNAPTSGIGLDGEFYIQTGVSPYAIWYKDAGTWLQVTGSAIYVALTGDQTIGGTKTFSQVIQGSISGNAATADHATSADTATYATSAGSASTATNADHATNADSATLAGNVTGIVAIVNGGTGASDASTARSNLGLGTAATKDAGVALGVATLDAGGTVPLSQIPASLQGGVSYQGTWNATTNSPTLTSSVGTKGYYYVVSVAGSTNLNGITDWQIGDWAIFNGTAWEKIDNTDAVTSVNGYTGTVVLNAADVGALASITSSDGSITVSQVGTAVDLAVSAASPASTLLLQVRNNSGATMTKGTVVYVNGAIGQLPTVAKALATSDATSAQTQGLITDDIPNNSNGYVTIIGLVTDIDTSAYSDGDQLYLSGTTAGAMTTTKQYAPIHLVYVGVVTYAHPVHGKIQVKVQNGYELDELHNVSAQSPTTGQTIVYNSSTGLWEKSFAPVINGTTIDNTVIGGTTPAAGTFTTLTPSSVVAASTALNISTSDGITNFQVKNDSTNGTAGTVYVIGASASLGRMALRSSKAFYLASASTNPVALLTGSGTTTEGVTQLNVAHTASAVNYVQVTGAATGSSPTISAQGSDSAIPMVYAAKGGSSHQFYGSVGGTLQFQVSNVSSSVNRFSVNGSTTGNVVPLSTVGNDTNIGMVFQPKGTGAIDLAAGSSGVNISNGGTVTALTRTATGANNYTSIPTLTISAPTTAGGVQATATPTMYVGTATIQSGGTGYTLNDTITVSGGTFVAAATFTVSSVSGGVITGITQISGGGGYSVLPTNPVSVTGGTGTGATLNITGWGMSTFFTITNAGSGYVEQPTVSFSGGGGSGAAAYATVGSGVVIRSIGSAGLGSIDFNTPASATNGVPALRIRDVLSSTPANTGYFLLHNNNGYAQLTAQGPTDAQMAIGASGTGYIRFNTNGTSETNQMRVTHTASAVNYVQVTGAATGNQCVISAQGSDTTSSFRVASKGTSFVYLQNNGSVNHFSAGGTGSAVNYLNARGNASGNGAALEAVGSDTNVAMQLISKGTGAIDLAAGSSGVNISNGGTVTAITRTVAGTGYTSPPSVAIAAPTTAGGVQATASAFLQLAVTPTITSGGTGYSVNDVLTFSGGVIGSGSTASAVTVTSVSGGVITGISISQFGSGYSTVPTNPISVTGGTGTGATFTVSGWQVSVFSITNAGSGYVEQPTVSFSGGGGSGAAAYAVVGSQPLVKGLNTINFGTNSGTHLQLLDGGLTNVNFLRVQGGSTVYAGAAGSDTNVSTIFYSRGTGNVSLGTNSGAQEQLRVAHTASAVNYVQVTGAATGAKPTISVQGSDTNIDLNVQPKGSGLINIVGASRIGNNLANYFVATGGATTVAPSLAASGSDTNIDLALTPKGTGYVKFGTYTATMALTVQGYVEIKDSGGTVRKLAVIA